MTYPQWEHKCERCGKDAPFTAKYCYDWPNCVRQEDEEPIPSIENLQRKIRTFDPPWRWK